MFISKRAIGSVLFYTLRIVVILLVLTLIACANHKDGGVGETKSDQRKEYVGPIATDEVDKLLADSGITYYFWSWDTSIQRDVPLLSVYIGSDIDTSCTKFRRTMLDKQVRVRFINHSEIKY